MTADAQRRRTIGQIVLLAAALLVLVAISAASVLLVNKSREDNGWVVHTVEVENQLSTLLLQIRLKQDTATKILPSWAVIYSCGWRLPCEVLRAAEPRRVFRNAGAPEALL